MLQTTIKDRITELSLENKYTKWYILLCEKYASRCSNRKEAAASLGYIESHHIIPKSIDKSYMKDSTNLIYVTGREHFILHMLLAKMFKHKTHYIKMKEAFSIFSNNSNRNLRFTSRQIHMLREANSIAASIRNTGNQHYKFRSPDSDDLRKLKSNNAKNSRWVNDGTSNRFSQDHVSLVTTGEYVYGKLITPEQKIMYKELLGKTKGIPRSQKARENYSKVAIERQKRNKELGINTASAMNFKKECPHCGTITTSGNYGRWHGDKCKQKP